MSRERPTEPLRAVPDAERGLVKHETPRQRRAREEIERLKATHGSAFMSLLFNPFGRPKAVGPQFIRRGYEASILDELNEFYAKRPRPWRPRSNSSCKPTLKERLRAQRRAPR